MMLTDYKFLLAFFKNKWNIKSARWDYLKSINGDHLWITIILYFKWTTKIFRKGRTQDKQKFERNVFHCEIHPKTILYYIKVCFILKSYRSFESDNVALCDYMTTLIKCMKMLKKERLSMIMLKSTLTLMCQKVFLEIIMLELVETHSNMKKVGS